MSWNIQRPDGVGGMTPSQGQPYMNHEQLLSNRDGETDPLFQAFYCRRPFSLFLG